MIVAFFVDQWLTTDLYGADAVRADRQSPCPIIGDHALGGIAATRRAKKIDGAARAAADG